MSPGGGPGGGLGEARALRARGRHAEAARHLESLVGAEPDSAEAWATLGSTCFRLNRFDRARTALERAVALAPGFAEGWLVLGNCRINQGDILGAMEAFERARVLRPGSDEIASSALFYAAFHPDATRERLFRANAAWGRDYAERATPFAHARANATDSGRRLRLGYISYEFTAHVTSYFFAPVLARHDHDRFEIFVYAGNPERDATTEALRGQAEHWRDISALDPGAAAARVHEDGVDILVLVSSYRALHRRVLAFKPAPIQVAYHNLVATTGLAAVDYAITEEATDPTGAADPFYVEKLVRIRERNCYAPPPGCPEVAPPPAAADGAVTFGSFNNVAKITPAMAAAWARILIALPQARLALKNILPMVEEDWAPLLGLLGQAGAPPERVRVIGHIAERSSHLAAYGDIDIALDTFPCNGGTTSCDALWMGVPIVTLCGETFMSRQSSTYLAKLGLADLVAESADAYVDIALRLAGDAARRAALRRELRPLMRTRLLDYDRHVAELESAYAAMWRRHCAGQPPAAFSPTPILPHRVRAGRG